MATYDPFTRLESGTWILAHIETLIATAIERNDSTMVVYACFETRNLIEKLEYYIINVALTDTERVKYVKALDKKGGLGKAFGVHPPRKSDHLKETIFD